MEFTELCASGVTPGHLTLWHPTPGDPAAWAADDRPPAVNPYSHLREVLDRGGTAGHPTWLGSSFRLDPRSEDRISSALGRWFDRHEALRSHVEPAGKGLRRRTLPPGSVVVRPEVIGRVDDEERLRRRIEEFFDTATDPRTWPHTVFATVRSATGLRLYFAGDHGNLDCYSMASAAHEIRALLGHGPEPDEPAASFLDFGPQEEATTVLGETSDVAVAAWKEFLSLTADGRCPGFPASPAGRSAAVTTHASSYRRLLDAEETDRFSKEARASGGSTFSGLLASVGLATAAFAEADEVSLVTLMHTRSERWRNALGWFTGLSPLRMPVPAGAEFASLTGAVHRLMGNARQVARLPAPLVEGALGVPVDPGFAVSYVDFRGMPGAQDWQECDNRLLRSRLPAGDEFYLWFTRSRQGLYLSCRFPGSAEWQAVATSFLDALRHSLLRTSRGPRTVVTS